MDTSIVKTPLRRRSALQTPVTLEEPNDENERSTRRSLVDTQKRTSNISQHGSPQNEVKFFGEKEMKDHFQICTKLFAENKISPKNAWHLHIIDLLQHISQKSTGDTLQIASTSLDISAKVYGVRVDAIHSNGLKLASTIARVSEKETPQQLGEDGEPGAEGDKDNAAAKKKKKNKRLSAGENNIIAKDRNSLMSALPKLESVFFSTRINAETSAIDNLFTNTLPMDNSGYKFMLFSRDKAWLDLPDPLVNGPDAINKKHMMKINPFHKVAICKPFKDFIVNEWDLDEEEKQLRELSVQGENEVVFDNNGIPISELDGSIHDIFDENDQNLMDVDEDQVEEQEEGIAEINGEIAHIVEFALNSVNRTEYSYNSVVCTRSGKIIDQIWAGPSHWKLKYIRKSNMKFSGKITKKLVKKNKKSQKPQSIDFWDDDYDDGSSLSTLKINKKPPSADPKKITLPLPDKDSVEFMSTMDELSTRPGCKVFRSKLPSKSQEIDHETPNDSEYCSQHTDPGMPDDNDISDGEEIAIAAQENFLGENLVDVPEVVPKTHLTYASQAKKMDMRKLKNAVYHVLTNDKSVNSEKCEKDLKIIPKTFGEAYKELPNILSEKMKRELTAPMALFAALHLANEKDLTLTQHSSYEDFDISGPSREQ